MASLESEVSSRSSIHYVENFFDIAEIKNSKILKKFSTKRKYGLELELSKSLPKTQLTTAIKAVDQKHSVQVSGWDSSKNNNYWHVKEDSTCGDTKRGKPTRGLEIATYKAGGFKDLNNICNVVDSLKAHGARINENCGLHLHVEIKDFAYTDAARLVANWCKIESIIFQALPSFRRSNIYCSPLSNFYGASFAKNQLFDSQSFWKIVKPKSFGLGANPYRRLALNMVNYANPDKVMPTVEFRMMEGTLLSTEVKNWVRLLITFIECSKNELPFPKNLRKSSLKSTLAILGLHHKHERYVLSQSLEQTKIWFLKRLFKFSTDEAIRAKALDLLRD